MFLLLFCFFLSHGCPLGALTIRAEAEGTTSAWACLSCNPRTLPITSCFGNVITKSFWRQAQGAVRVRADVAQLPHQCTSGAPKGQLRSHHGSSGPPSPFTRGETEAQKAQATRPGLHRALTWHPVINNV